MLKHTAPTLAGVTAPTVTATVSQRPLRPLAIAASAISAANNSSSNNGNTNSSSGGNNASAAAVSGSCGALQPPPAAPRTPQPVSLQPLQLLQTTTAAAVHESANRTLPNAKIANGGIPRALTNSTTQLYHYREPSHHQYQNTLPHLHHHSTQSTETQHSAHNHTHPQLQHIKSNSNISLHQQPPHNHNTYQQQTQQLSTLHQHQQQLCGNSNSNSQQHQQQFDQQSNQQHNTSCIPRNNSNTGGVREALTSLGLLCLVSLLLALLSLIFLLKISPGGRDLLLQPAAVPVSAQSSANSAILAEDYVVVYDVTLALCALSLSLNLCCLLVCAVQFLFAVKLVRNNVSAGTRGNKYLQKSSASRICAVGGFFVSIPVFLTGIILYTFTQFHSTPAIVTSVLIGIGILFCGGAMVHNVFVWQREKTISVRHSVLQAAAAAAAASATQQQLNQLNSSQHQLLRPHQHASGAAHAHSASVQSLTAAVGAQKDHNSSGAMYLNHVNHPTMTMLNQSISHSLANTSQHTPISPHTPLTPNSHNISAHLSSFNQHGPYMPSSTSYLRPATSTPPTPKNITTMLHTPRENSRDNLRENLRDTSRDLSRDISRDIARDNARETSGSISPTAGGNSATGLDMSSAATISPHELSTLV